MKAIDRQRFQETYAAHFKAPLSADATLGIDRLLTSLEADPTIDDVRWAAYMLATVKHECAGTWLPIIERGQRSYFDKYDAGTALGRRLGNDQVGDGFRYRGRGFVQITGRANYARMSQLLRLEQRLVEDPEHALEHDVAYAIMSHGMVSGAFTGRKLAQYIAGPRCEYVDARALSMVWIAPMLSLSMRAYWNAACPRPKSRKTRSRSPTRQWRWLASF